MPPSGLRMADYPLSRLTYHTSDLIPSVWLESDTLDNFVYNPAIVRFRHRLLMAYRVDSGQGAAFQRRIGLCSHWAASIGSCAIGR